MNAGVMKVNGGPCEIHVEFTQQQALVCKTLRTQLGELFRMPAQHQLLLLNI